MPDWLDPEAIILGLGNWALWGIALIIFAECGLFAPLPGDSLLFTAGLFVAMGVITFGSLPPFPVLLVVAVILTIAAVGGNVSGYYLGRLIGPPLFKPRDGVMGKLFDPKYVDATHVFMEKYGSRALILARFVPFVRTFITLIAGVAHMDFRVFIKFTAVGGVLWVWLITFLGYFLGTIPVVHDNLEVALLLIVFVSLIPMFVEYFSQKRKGAAEVTPE